MRRTIVVCDLCDKEVVIGDPFVIDRWAGRSVDAIDIFIETDVCMGCLSRLPRPKYSLDLASLKSARSSIEEVKT